MTSIVEAVVMMPRVMMELVYKYARSPQTEYFPKRLAPVIEDRIVETMWGVLTVNEFVCMCEANNVTSDDYDRPCVSSPLSLFNTALFWGNVSLVRFMCEQRLKRHLQWTGSPRDYPKNLPSPNLLHTLQAEAGSALE